jgi:hypothetical protein
MKITEKSKNKKNTGDDKNRTKRATKIKKINKRKE